MMPDVLVSEALVTAENVASVADLLTEREEKASVRAIIQELGGGSPNAVLKFLRQWKGSKAEIAEPQPVAQVQEPVALDAAPEVASLLKQTSSTMLSMVGRIRSTERKTAEDRVASLMTAHTDEVAVKDRQHREDLAALQDILDDTKSALDEAEPYIAEALGLRQEAARLVAVESGLLADNIRLEADVVSGRATLSQALEKLAAAVSASRHAEGEAQAWRAQLQQSQDELAALRKESAAAVDAIRQESAAAVELARKEGAGIADGLRVELDTTRANLAAAHASIAEIGAEARAADQRLEDIHAELKHERTSHERMEGRLEMWMDRAAKAEAELIALRK